MALNTLLFLLHLNSISKSLELKIRDFGKLRKTCLSTKVLYLCSQIDTKHAVAPFNCLELD